MPLLTFTPPATAPLDPGGVRNHAPKVYMADFGDGFSQRVVAGPNNNPAKRSLKWSNLTEAEKDVIDDFLAAREGAQAFLYNHRGEGVKAYICPEWSVTEVDYNAWTVEATFQQVYDVG